MDERLSLAVFHANSVGKAAIRLHDHRVARLESGQDFRLQAVAVPHGDRRQSGASVTQGEHRPALSLPE